MRPLPKTVCTILLLALATSGHALLAGPAAAQAPAVGTKTAKAKPAPLPAPQPAAQPSPAPASQPLAVSQPMAEETEHVARYDAAIAPARDHALTDADSASLREAMAAASGGRLTDARARRDQITRPRRAQAGRLVSLPWRIWHGIGDSRLSQCQPGLARARAARPARRGGAVQQRGRRGGGPGLLRQRPTADGRRSRRAGDRLSGRQGRGQGQGAGAEGLDRSQRARRAWSRPSSSALAPCSRKPTTSAASTACCSTTAAGPASATSARPSSAA